MRRAVKLLLAAAAVYVAFRVGQFGWSAFQAERWSQALWRQVERGPGAVVDFTEFGPPGWDRVFIFHPYTPRSSIHTALGFRWPDAERTSIAMSDGVNLIVFVRNGEVAGWFEHPRNRGDFTEAVGRTTRFARAEARFVVTLDGERRVVLDTQRKALALLGLASAPDPALLLC